MRENPATFDPEADAAYFPAASQISAGEATENLMIERPNGTVILDFNDDGALLGIEVLGAEAVLKPATLKTLSPPRSDAIGRKL